MTTTSTTATKCDLCDEPLIEGEKCEECIEYERHEECREGDHLCEDCHGTAIDRAMDAYELAQDLANGL